MGWYRDCVVPRITDVVLSGEEFDTYRRRATDGLEGRIVEIGFGSGRNLPWYAENVTSVLAVEPSELARRMAADRADASTATVEYVGLDGQSLPIDTDSCDGALSTFTLCSIPDHRRALAELRRVVRPGGRVHLLEHGLARDQGVARWQRRLEPLQKRVAAGCHLTRDHLADVQAAGLTVQSTEEWYGSGPKFGAAHYLITAAVPK